MATWIRGPPLPISQDTQEPVHPLSQHMEVQRAKHIATFGRACLTGRHRGAGLSGTATLTENFDAIVGADCTGLYHRSDTSCGPKCQR